jgi:cobalt-zinc-cadmium resistance protein CzcA
VSISAIQSFALPSVYRSKKEFYQAQSQLGVEAKQVTQNELTYQVKQAYYQWLFLYEKMELIRSRDSLLQDLKRIASLKVKAGETSPIEQSRAALEAGQIQQQLQEIEQEIQIQMQILQNLLNTKEDLRPRQTKMTRPQNELLSIEVANNPTLNYLQQSEKLQLAQSQWYKSQKKPSLHAGYFNMREAGTFNRHVVIAGLSIPIGRSEAKNVQEVAQMQADMISQEREYKQRQLTQQLKVLQDKLLQNSQKRAYYEGEALTLAKNIQEKTRKSYRLGEIDYYQFAQTRQEVFLIEQSYLQTLLTHYLLQSEMEYLAGK